MFGFFDALEPLGRTHFELAPLKTCFPRHLSQALTLAGLQRQRTTGGAPHWPGPRQRSIPSRVHDVPIPACFFFNIGLNYVSILHQTDK